MIKLLLQYFQCGESDVEVWGGLGGVREMTSH